MAGRDNGEVLVQMPGSALMVSYASQCERDRSLRLAQARQELAQRRAGLSGWAAPSARTPRSRHGTGCAPARPPG